jgi:hypothetical protein
MVLELAAPRRDISRLACPIADQAALFGLLNRVRDLGLTLLWVKRIVRRDYEGDDP